MKLPVMEVYCKECGVYHTKDQVKALEIEEDAWGRDFLTFKCLVTDCITRSLIFLKKQ
jgi:hypothetical protein